MSADAPLSGQSARTLGDLIERVARAMHSVYCDDVACEVGAVMAVDVRAASAALRVIADDLHEDPGDIRTLRDVIGYLRQEATRG